MGADASLDQVARRAGVGIGTLYRHFPTRDDLLIATLQDSLQSMAKHGRALLTHPSPGEALRRWLKSYLKHATTYSRLAVCLPPLKNGDSACEMNFEAGAALLARAQKAKAARRDVDFEDVSTMCSGVAFAVQETLDPARQKKLVALFLDSLSPRSPVPVAASERPRAK